MESETCQAAAAEMADQTQDITEESSEVPVTPPNQADDTKPHSSQILTPPSTQKRKRSNSTALTDGLLDEHPPKRDTHSNRLQVSTARRVSFSKLVANTMTTLSHGAFLPLVPDYTPGMIVQDSASPTSKVDPWGLAGADLQAFLSNESDPYSAMAYGAISQYIELPPMSWLNNFLSINNLNGQELLTRVPVALFSLINAPSPIAANMDLLPNFYYLEGLLYSINHFRQNSRGYKAWSADMVNKLNFFLSDADRGHPYDGSTMTNIDGPVSRNAVLRAISANQVLKPGMTKDVYVPGGKYTIIALPGGKMGMEWKTEISIVNPDGEDGWMMSHCVIQEPVASGQVDEQTALGDVGTERSTVEKAMTGLVGNPSLEATPIPFGDAPLENFFPIDNQDSYGADDLDFNQFLTDYPPFEPAPASSISTLALGLSNDKDDTVGGMQIDNAPADLAVRPDPSPGLDTTPTLLPNASNVIQNASNVQIGEHGGNDIADEPLSGGREDLASLPLNPDVWDEAEET
ncbi:uncharacterized protein KY384_008054 [Bacidia gigantensis]|uniref:uncharacterized protein n=1 Tax=Bacidia gigantensis TaxID=2732470 RepID=UPI001D05967B|nr:uncharacterized protein KY384_008054 [Bacidia gigantensis]KAG8527310.1 hypothetical protein KY384_008054 [Bacidia gigantensis]